MNKQVLKVKYFHGSTLAEVENKENEFLEYMEMTPFDVVDFKLYNFDDNYQKIIYFTEECE